MNLGSRPSRFPDWLLPLIVSLGGCYVLFVVTPYAVGNGISPVSLFKVTGDIWAGSSDWSEFWTGSSEWKHGILVLPLIALVLYLKRKEIAQVPIKRSWTGIPVLLLAVLLYWVGFITDLQYVGYLAIQAFVAGLVLWFLGTRFFARIFFIWLFLLFAWPFVFLDQYVGFPLRMVMCSASEHVLNLLGVPTVREGTAILSAPNAADGLTVGQRFSVDIADPCSGIHSLFALTMISALYAILVFRRWWQILIVIVSAVPLAIFGNLCRIVMLTFGTLFFGENFAIGTEENPTWFHMGAGFVVYFAALGGVLLIGWLVDRGSSAGADKLVDGDKPERAQPRFTLVGLMVVVAITALASGPTFLGQGLNQERESGVNMTLPDSVSGYLGFNEAVTPAELRILPADTEFAKKRYVGSAPVDVSCEIVLSGATKSSIHRPQVCLVAQGWTLQQEEAIPINLADGQTQKVRIITLTRTEDGRAIGGYYVYWYVGKDVTTDSNLTRIVLTSWDRVVRHINHRWAYVSIAGFFPNDSAGSGSIRERVKSDLLAFARDVIPVIQQSKVNAVAAR